MKKHYIKMTAVITLLILAAFLLAGGFYTYVITTKTMNEAVSSVRRGKHPCGLNMTLQNILPKIP